MAKNNLFVNRGMVADPSSVDPNKRLRTGGDCSHAGYPSPSPYPLPPPPALVWGTTGYMAPPLYDPYGAYPVHQVALPTPPPMPACSGYGPVQNAKDNPPCNTLFIGNLGETKCRQPGFKQMKVQRQERNTVCFIECVNPFGRRKDSTNGVAREVNGTSVTN